MIELKYEREIFKLQINKNESLKLLEQLKKEK